MELPRTSSRSLYLVCKILAGMVGAFCAGVGFTWLVTQHLAAPVRSAAAPARCVETHVHVAPSTGGSWVQLPQLSRVMNFTESSRIVYLNREGATLRAGVDDAAENRSSVVRAAGLVLAELPEFAGSSAEWHALKACIRGRFAAYNLRITDRRPLPTESYIMAVFGGDARALGRAGAQEVGGLAPFNGQPSPRRVVFVFTEALHRDPAAMCETASMELAHAFGLDHAYDCADIMSYLPRCGPRRFLDQETPCGEHTTRLCARGAATQNSHRYLLELLGPARSARRGLGGRRPWWSAASWFARAELARAGRNRAGRSWSGARRALQEGVVLAPHRQGLAAQTL